MTKAGAIWTAACPASAPLIDSVGHGIDGGALWLAGRSEAGVSGLRPRAPRVLRNAFAPRCEQQVQDVQGRIVPAYREGTEPSAPATAHVNTVYVMKDGSGPSPWRRPV